MENMVTCPLSNSSNVELLETINVNKLKEAYR